MTKKEIAKKNRIRAKTAKALLKSFLRNAISIDKAGKNAIL